MYQNRLSLIGFSGKEPDQKTTKNGTAYTVFSLATKADVRARYDYLYRPEELEPWVARIKKVAEDAEETYAVTNNHINALELEAFLSGGPVRVPPVLLEHYPDLPGNCKEQGGRSSDAWLTPKPKPVSSSRCSFCERTGCPRAMPGNTSCYVVDHITVLLWRCTLCGVRPTKATNRAFRLPQHHIIALWHRHTVRSLGVAIFTG